MAIFKIAVIHLREATPPCLEGAQIEASSWFLPEDARAPTSFSLLHREALPIPSDIKLSAKFQCCHKSVNINLCVLECNAIEWDFFLQVHSHPTSQDELCATLLAVGIF